MVVAKAHSRFFRLVLLAALVLSPWLDQPALAHTESAGDPLHKDIADASNDLLQFQSGGHVLGFAPDGMLVSNGTYALRVEFVDANAVTLQAAESGTPANGAAPQLTQVTYPDLWDGITLAYDAVGGLSRSTYTVAPGADPAAIRLRYNAPVAVEADGSLRIDYETGVLHESAPVAWQEIGGARVPVEVAFALLPGGDVSFRLGYYDPRYPLTIDPTLTWHTFLGGSGADGGMAIAVDRSGNVYVAGFSTAAWGNNPILTYTDGVDVFVASLGSDGSLTWHTFLGGSGGDYSTDIFVDSNGSIYVTGWSSASWGSPVRAYSGGHDAFVAQLGSDGSLAWHTFLGGSGGDYSNSIAVDGNGNVYVVGWSSASWGSPVRAYTGSYDAFAAKLGSDGSLTWHTFLGGSGTDRGLGIAVDDGENVYVAGSSLAAWGNNPVRPYGDSGDAFVAKLGSDGSFKWHTFLGGSGWRDSDEGGVMVLDDSGSVYVTGFSDATWGSPVRPYSGGDDAFVAKLGSDGSLTWHTFLGGSGTDYGIGIAVDGSGSIYVAGKSDASWGSPAQAYTGGGDAFAAQLRSDGSLVWNTFLGGSDSDYGNDVALDGSGSVYVVGYSGTAWGSPLRAYSGDVDAFVAKLGPLALTKSVSAASAGPGEAVTYTITFGNTRPITATDVVITDALSAAITEASYTSSGVALTQVVSSRYTWTVSDLVQNEGGIITLTGVLTKPLSAGVFTNTVTLAASGMVLTADAPLTVLNTPPVADAGGDQAVHVGASVTLDGSGSYDDNGDALTYGWTQTGGTAVAFTPDISITTLTAPAVTGVLTFTLVVTDSYGLGSTVADEVVVTVTNNPPVADAGGDQTVYVGTVVMLDGSGSRDSDGDVLAYTWAQAGGPTVALSGATTVTASFTAGLTIPTVYTFTLTVDDGELEDTDTVVITVARYACYLPLVLKQ